MADKWAHLIQVVEKVKSQGHKNIPTDDLLSFLKTVQGNGQDDEVNRKFYEGLNHAANLETLRQSMSIKIEMFKAVLTFGNNALRATFLLNGTASISLLAFLGNIWAKSQGSISGQSLALPLLIFTLGAFLSVVATGLAWFSQDRYTKASYEYNPFVDKGPVKCRTGDGLKVTSAITATLSLFFFLWGIYEAMRVFFPSFPC